GGGGWGGRRGVGGRGGVARAGAPPNVSRGFERGTTAGPSLRKPTNAAPIASGRTPYALEMRTRTRLPPRLTRGIIRSVWLLNAAPSAGAGAAVHVPTQCVVSMGVRLLEGGLYSLTLRDKDSCLASGSRSREPEHGTEVRDDARQADLRRFPRERADGSVGRARGEEVPRPRAPARRESERPARRLFLLRRLRATSDRDRLGGGEEPGGAGAVPHPRHVRRRAARWVGSGGTIEGQRARWGRGGRALHDVRLPDLLVEGRRAAAGLLPRLQRLVG